MSFLEKMRKKTLLRVNSMRNQVKILNKEALKSREPKAFKELSRKDPLYISELKFSSPSEGIIRKKSDIYSIINEYLNAGASAISILTESTHFGGSIEYLAQARASFPDSFILMKDFIIDETQIYQARIHGADAILLIVGMLKLEELIKLMELTQRLSLTAFIEVNNEDELRIALSLNPEVILINNRNLHTLKVDIETSFRLKSLIPDEICTISASGIQEHATVLKLKSIGFNGFLIGSHLMKSDSPGDALRKIINGDHPYES